MVGISFNELSRCFNVETQNGIGTAFLYSDTRGDVFFTAAHLMKGVCPGDYIYIRRIEGKIQFCVEKILLNTDGYDVGVFTCKEAVSVPQQRPGSHDGVYMGQELKFIGFPHGLKNQIDTENGFPIPLVRTAFFSGKVKIDGKELFLLDGFNNPGYSGSPVYCGINENAFLFGIVSGYKNELGDASKIFTRDDQGNEKEVSDYFLKSNSGIIYAITLQAARALLDEFHKLR